MKPAPFPREMKAVAKRDGLPLVRVQFDARHQGDEAVEVVGVAPTWVVVALQRVLREWRDESDRNEVIH